MHWFRLGWPRVVAWPMLVLLAGLVLAGPSLAFQPAASQPRLDLPPLAGPASERVARVATDTPGVALALTMTAEPADASPGELITYSLRLTNSGPTPAPRLVISDTLPAGLVYVPGSAGSGRYDPRTRRLTWSLNALDVRTEATFSFQARVTGQAPNPLPNTVEASSPDLRGRLTATTWVHVRHTAEQVVRPGPPARLTAPGGRVWLDFPAGAVTETLRVRYRSLAARRLAAGRTGLALQFALTAWPANGSEPVAPITRFAKPLRLTVDLTGLLDGEAPGLYKRWFAGYWEETTGRWVSLPVVDFQPGPVLTVEVDHFTPFGAGATGIEDWGWALNFNDAQVALFDGAFAYDYPLEVPPGRAGLTPEVNLSYNSRRVDGVISWIQPDWAGLGWSIDSVEIVRQDVRRCRDPYSDRVCYPEEFVLVLNGTAYELKPGTGTAPFGRYHTANETFLYIERRDDQTMNPGEVTTPEYWIVRTQEGTTYELGKTEESEQVFGPHAYDDNGDGVPGGTYPGDGSVPLMGYRWRVNQVTDAHGNQIVYRYDYDQQVGIEKETKANQCGDAELTQGHACSGSLADNSQRAHYLHTIEYNHLDDGTPGVKIVFRLARRGSDVADLTAPIAYGQTGMPLAVFWQRYYLQSIQVQFWNTNTLTHEILSEYVFSYDEQSQPEGHNNHTRRLKQIVPYGRGGELGGNARPATSFGYGVYRNKGWNCTDRPPNPPDDPGYSCSPWDRESFRYERLTEVRNGYGGVITATYQTPDQWDAQYWLAWNYRVEAQWTQDRGAVVSQMDYTYPGDVADRCYEDPQAEGQCKDPASFAGGLTGGRLVGYKWTRETLKDSGGNPVAIREHDFWLKAGKTGPTFALGREIETRYKEPSGTILQTVQRTYVDDTAGRPAGVHFIRLERVDRYAGDTTGPHSRTEYSYDAYGNLTRVMEHGADAAGDERTTHYRYHPRDDGTTYIVDRVARESVYAGLHFNDDDDPTRLKARTRYHYDLVDPTDPLLPPQPQAWTAPPTAGLLTQVDAWNGGLTGDESQDYSITGYRYDAYGNRIRVTDPLSRTTTTEYDGLFHTYPITHTNALGQTTLTQYYGVNGAPATGAGAFFGAVEAITDPNGATTRYTYDAFGRVAAVRRPGDESGPATVQYSYTDGPLFRVQMDRRQDGSTVRTSYRFYDGLGRLIQSKEPLPNSRQAVQHTAYDARGQVAREYVPYAMPAGAGYVPEDTGKPHTGYAYDGLGRPTLLTHPDGRTVQTSYAGWQTTVVDENGHQRVYERDGYGRLVRVEEYTGTGSGNDPYVLYATTRYGYDALDHLRVVTDTLGNETTITYDPLGRKVELDDPDMGVWAYRYDAAGNLEKQRDGRNQAICFYYDGLNRLVGKTYHAGVTDLDTLICPGAPYAVRYGYDDGAFGKGRRTGMTDDSGHTSWDYDARGRVVTETLRLGALGAYTTTYSYNSQDQVVTTTYPDGEVITRTYNIAGWPATLTGSLGDTYVSASTYNAQGQPKTIQLGGGLVTRFGYYGYNGWGMGDGDDAPDQSWANVHVGKLWKLCTVPAGQACPQAGHSSSVLDLRYSYDGVGNITSLRDRTGGGDELQTFTYDDLDRLTGASGAYSAGYTYDAIGNLRTKSEGGVSYTLVYTATRPVHAPSTVNGVAYTYDANGNLEARGGESYAYDAENRLAGVTTAGGETVSFTYDGDGRRVMRDTATETVVYVGPHYELRFDKTSKPEDLDGDCQVTVADIMAVAAQWGTADPLADVNDDGTVDIADVQQVAWAWRETCHVLAGTTKYYSLGGRRVAMRQAGTLYYLLADHLGSTSVSYRSDGSDTRTQRYHPWGTIRPGPNNALPTDYTFTGQKLDTATDLLYYSDGTSYGRHYDPALARWTQPDPIVPAPGNPQALNRYSYVYNNPTRYMDPTGRYIFEEEPRDFFFIPPSRNPISPEAMRLANDPCLGACTGAPLSDPQTTAIVQTLIGVLWEPADWGMTFYTWSQGNFSWWDAVGLLPIIPAAVVRHADELEEIGDIVYRVVRADEHPNALTHGLQAKDPSRRVHPHRHVSHGRTEKSNWISTTRDLNWARQFQGEEPIYVIDLSKVKSTIVDLTVPGATEGWFPWVRNLARRASEVLIDTYIPPEAIIDTIP